MAAGRRGTLAKLSIAALIAAAPAGGRAVQQGDAAGEVERLAGRALDLQAAGRGEEALATFERIGMLCADERAPADRCADALAMGVEAASLRYRHDLAISWAGLALSATRQANGADHPAAGLALTALGEALAGAQRFAEAEAAHAEAIAILERSRGAGHRATDAARAALARMLRVAGRYEDAETLDRAVLDNVQGRENAGAIETGVAFNALGQDLYLQQRYREAETLFRASIDRLDNGESLPALEAANNLALTLAALDRASEAEPIQRRLLERQRAIWGGDGPRTTPYAVNLAASLVTLGSADEAARMLRPLLDAARHAQGRASPQIATLSLNLARAELAAGRPDRAGPLFEAAASMRSDLLGPRHPSTIDALEALGRFQLESGAPNMAVETLERAASAVRAEAAGAALDPRRALELRARRPLFEALVEALWRAAIVDPGAADALRERAFEAAQWAMTSESSLALGRVAAGAAAQSDELASLERRRADLVAERVGTEAAYYGLVDLRGTVEEAERRRLSERLPVLARELADVEQAIARSAPAYFDLSRPSSSSASEVRRLLRRDEAMLLLLSAPDATYAFAVTAEGGSWVRADLHAATLADAVNRLRQSAQDDVFFEPPAFDRTGAYRLYGALIAPLAGELSDRERLLVVSDGPLAGLPLALLVTAEPVGADDDPAALSATPFLADRHRLASLPAASSLGAMRCVLADPSRRSPACPNAPVRAEPRAAATAEFRFAGIGAPTLHGSAAAPVRGEGAASSLLYGNSFSAGLADPQRLRALPPLPGSRREIEQLGDTFPPGMSALRLGDDAREAAVKRDPALAAARFVVFSTHGLLASQSGAVGEPGLVLTPPDTRRSAEDDGLLTASEAARLRLAAELLVLSACNTGTDEGNAGGGLSALSRAFLVAGARALLVSHWSVSDDATAALMIAFFREIDANPTGDRAMLFQRAMRTLRRDPRWASPGFWAAFTLIGTGD